MRELTNFEINWIEKKLKAYIEHLMEKMQEWESKRLEEYGDAGEDLEIVKAEIHKVAEQERQLLIEKYKNELEKDCYASGEDDGSHICYDGQIIRDHDLLKAGEFDMSTIYAEEAAI